MNPLDIWNEVKSILETEVSYLTIYEGIRGNIPKGRFPCIFMEPKTDPEDKKTFPVVDPTFTILLLAYIKIEDKDKQVIGDGTNKGILEVEQDIKRGLGKYYNLNGKCIVWGWAPVEWEIGRASCRERV